MTTPLTPMAGPLSTTARLVTSTNKEWRVATLVTVKGLRDRLEAALPRPQPGDERRDEQGKAEQLVGPGDDPNDRDDG